MKNARGVLKKNYFKMREKSVLDIYYALLTMSQCVGKRSIAKTVSLSKMALGGGRSIRK